VPLDAEGAPEPIELRETAAVRLDLVERPAPRRVVDITLLRVRELVAEHEHPDAEASGGRMPPSFERAAPARGQGHLPDLVAPEPVDLRLVPLQVGIAGVDERGPVGPVVAADRRAERGSRPLDEARLPH